MRFREELNISLHVDRTSREPLCHQLSQQIEAAITAGSLQGGSRVPATRTLANALGISRTVVISAYLDLFGRGLLVGQAGSGTYVADQPPGSAAQPASRDTNDRPALLDLGPGCVGVQGFPLEAWRAAWRRATHHPPDPGPQPPAGLDELREGIAAHLRWSRGLNCSAANIVVTHGETHSLDLVTRATTRPGCTAVLEEPGHPSIRRTLEDRGLHIAYAATDKHGIIPSSLPASPTVIVTSPTHHFPTGVCLPESRREELVETARRAGALLIEDDPGADYLHTGSPLPSLAHMSAMRNVVHIGTLSTLMAQIGIGYIVADPDIVQRITALQDACPPPAVVQQATAHLLSGGHMGRYLSKMRWQGRVNRRLLGEALAPVADRGSLVGTHAGLHAVLELDGRIPAQVVQKLLSDRRIRVPALTEYYQRPINRNALVIGYGGHDETTLRRGLRALVSTIHSVTATASHVA